MANMFLCAVVALILAIHVEAILETNHLIEIDGNGNKVAMDVTYDSEKNTVLAIVGDVSKYKGGRQTVNLHDFNTKTGYIEYIVGAEMEKVYPVRCESESLLAHRINHLHLDTNHGYGVLKDINRKTCLLGQSFTRRAMPEKYRMGVTYEVHEHILDVSPEAMSKEEVYALGGQHIASFCNDYATYLTKRAPRPNNGKKVATLSSGSIPNAWCVFSSCLIAENPGNVY